MVTARARTDEQIRADVERALRQAVGLATALPSAVIRRMLRCAAHTTSRFVDLVPPLRLMRSAFDVTLANVISPAESRLDGAASIPGASAADTPSASVETAAAVADPAEVVGPQEVAEAPAAADDLPIAEYESLAASHVVARLESLTPDELRAVQAFEAAHRGRRTVLGKIDQLLA